MLNRVGRNDNIIPTLKIPKAILIGQSNSANSRPATKMHKAKLALKVRKPKIFICLCLSIDTLGLVTALQC